MATDFKTQQCKPCSGETAAMDRSTAEKHLANVTEWTLNETATAIEKTYTFKNYYQTMAFVNAVAWIAHQQDHHPTLTIEYRTCHVRYNTHAVAGLSENDFICAARFDAALTT